MNSSHAEHSASLIDEGLRLNQDLVRQINQIVEGAHASSECAQPARPMLIESLLWTVAGAIVWVATLYLL